MVLTQSRTYIGLWLLTGTLMVFLMALIGGVTRITESGLSITEWKPVKGAIPPLNETEWLQEFDLYKQKAQYKTINEGMSLSEFKHIYFWEYFHRNWARLMSAIFVIGFASFLYKRWLNRDLLWRISPLIIWGALEGVVGWQMVSHGLKGIFVPPVYLSAHLLMALGLYGYLVWITLYVFRGRGNYGTSAPGLKKLAVAILTILYLQLFLGGIMSGMKAGLAYPTWPDMNGAFIPSALFSEKATTIGFLTYNAQDLWGRTLIQVLHRFTAYTLVVLVLIFFYKSRNITSDKIFRAGLKLFPFVVLLQATIGVLTVLNCVGSIPVGWGVLHQAGAMLLIAETVFVIFHLYNTEPRPA